MKHTESNTDATDDALVFECDLPEPREKVWRALTEPELLGKWLLPNDIRPDVGAKFQLQPTPAVAPVECEILEAEPGRKLRWRQQEAADAVFVESVVTFELSDIPTGGTHLRVVHDGFVTCERRSTVVQFRARKTVCAGGSTVALRRAA